MKSIRAAMAAFACACMSICTAQAAVTGTLSGTQLRVILSGATDKARVKPDGSGNLLVIDDATSTTVFTTPNSGVQSLFVSGTNSPTQQATLDGAIIFPGGVSVGNIGTLIQVGEYDLGASGTYTANVVRNIFVGADGTQTVSPATIISAAGTISLFANTAGTAAGVFIGIEVQGASVSSSSGNITFKATGGTTAGGNHGVEVDATSTVSSSTGTIFFTGNGGAAPGDGNVGVRIQGDGTQLSGPISLIGTGGGTGTSSNNYGVEIVGGAVVNSASSFIVITGTGGAATGSGNTGVYVHGSGAVSGPTTVKCGAASNSNFELFGTAGGGSSIGIDVGAGGGTLTTTGSASLFLRADSINIDTTSAIVNIAGSSLGAALKFITGSTTTAVNLGGANSPGVLGITSAELARVTSNSQVSIASGTGGLTVSSSISGSWVVLNIGGSGPINGPGPVQAANINVSDSSSTAHSWTLTGTSITQDGNVPLSLGGLGPVNLVAGSGSDTFTVTSTNSRTLNVIGGNPAPPALPGDQLILPVTATSLTWNSLSSGYAGTAAFAGRGSVTFQQIESGSVAPAAYVVTTPASATAGVPFTFTVTVVDALGNILPSYSGTVHITSSDSGATLPANATLTGGTGTFNVTFATDGVQTVTATDTTHSALTETSSIILVNPAPATHFSVSAPASAAEGSAFSFTVNALDMFNNVDTNYSGIAHFTSTDGGATLPADAAIAGGTGTFVATLRTQGSQSITATDTSTSFTGTSGPIGVTAGPATHFVVTAPASAVAGVAGNVTVTALDVLNNVANSYAGVVHFTSSDGAAVLPANSSLSAGTGTFPVTFKTSGSQSVTATDTLTTTITATSNAVAVSGGPATHFSLATSAAATAGTGSTMLVTALDAFNNTATSYGGTVHFTSSDAAAILPANAPLVAGTLGLGVTFKTAGVQTITGTDTVTASITGTSGPVTVSPGAVTHFAVSAPASATSGTAFSFTATALDASNNTVPSYAGTVAFTSSDTQAVLPANATLTAGVGTFSATLKTAGSKTVTATDTVTSSITGTSNGISVAAGVATHFSVSAPANATASTAVSLNVQALDASNNLVGSYAGTVHFTSTDAQAVLPANTTLAAGIGTFNATLKTVGSRTITATDTVTSSVTGVTSAINVAPGAATQFTITAPSTAIAGTVISVTITALDAVGNTATGYTGTVHFTATDAQAVLPADVTLTNGVGTFNVTLKTPGSRTVTMTDTVTSSLTATTSAITVSAGAATHFSVTAPSNIAGGASFNLGVSALDAANNPATGYTGTVHFTSSDNSAVLPGDATLTNGTGTFAATLRTSGNQTVTATDTASASVTGSSALIAVSMNSYTAASATGTGTITASFTGGGATCSFVAPQFIAAPPGSSPVPPTLPDLKAQFPHGMFDFSLQGCDVGSTVTLTITYPTSIDQAHYWKYGPEASNTTAHWYVMPATISGNSVTFSITDGQQGDDDLSANGTIDDQGGPAFTPTAVPTLSEWMLGLLAAMLLGIGMRAGVSRRGCA